MCHLCNDSRSCLVTSATVPASLRGAVVHNLYVLFLTRHSFLLDITNIFLIFAKT